MRKLRNKIELIYDKISYYLFENQTNIFRY